MIFYLGLAAVTDATTSLAGFDLEAVFMYGLVALVIGLIAWNKYKEPPLSDPYAKPSSGRDLPVTAGYADLGPVQEVPVVGNTVPARKQP